MTPIPTSSIVALTRHVISAKGDWILPPGTTGTVVHIYHDDDNADDSAYIVEFAEPQVLVTLTRDIIRPV